MVVARKFLIWVIAAVAILLTASSRVSAQGQTGTITGVVVDSASRQPLAGVTIIVGDVRTRTAYVQVYDRLVGRVSVPQPRVVILPDVEAAGVERSPDVQPSVAGLED